MRFACDPWSGASISLIIIYIHFASAFPNLIDYPLNYQSDSGSKDIDVI